MTVQFSRRVLWEGDVIAWIAATFHGRSTPVVGADLGCGGGSRAALALSHHRHMTLWLVDRASAPSPLQRSADLEQAARSRARAFGCRARIAIGDVAPPDRIGDGTLDFIFIDPRFGEPLLSQAWLPKIRPSGWIMGGGGFVAGQATAAALHLLAPQIAPGGTWFTTFKEKPA